MLFDRRTYDFLLAFYSICVPIFSVIFEIMLGY